MSSIPKNSKIWQKRTQKRRRRSTTTTTSSSFRRRTHARGCIAAKTKKNGNGGRKKCSSRVSDKLEALKSLIPPQNGEILKTDQLFQETADYIVLLRTQVLVLQRLIEFYGPSSNGSENSTNVVS